MIFSIMMMILMNKNKCKSLRGDEESVAIPQRRMKWI